MTRAAQAHAYLTRLTGKTVRQVRQNHFTVIRGDHECPLAILKPCGLLVLTSGGRTTPIQRFA